MDGGDILAQQSFAVGERDNLESLSCKVQMKAPQLLLDVLENFCTYWARALPQENGEYWPMPQEKERLLDWSLPVAELDKIARAFGKFGSFAEFDGKEWLVEVATVWTEQHKLAPGTVAHVPTKKSSLQPRTVSFVCVITKSIRILQQNILKKRHKIFASRQRQSCNCRDFIL